VYARKIQTEFKPPLLFFALTSSCPNAQISPCTTRRSVHAMPEGIKGKVMQIFVYLKTSPDDNQYAHPVDIVPFVSLIENKVMLAGAVT